MMLRITSLCLVMLFVQLLFNGSLSYADAVNGPTAAKQQAFDVNAKPYIADVLWVDYAAKEHRLLYSRYDGEHWLAPEVVHRSTDALTSPAMVTDHKGSKLVVWSELKRRRMSLHYRRKSPDQAQWGNAVLLTNDYIENLATSMLVDLDNRIWVFWAASGKQLSDITFVHSDNGLLWSKPQRLHTENKVPDIHPIASLDKRGNIVVNWATYSYLQQDYVAATKLIELSYESDQLFDFFNDSGELEDEISLDEVIFPAFLPNNALSHIHFPFNKMLQSQPIVPSVGSAPAL